MIFAVILLTDLTGEILSMMQINLIAKGDYYEENE
jgi:hypothetical protein